MKEKITDYLGFQASLMLRDEPFNGWEVERSLEEDLDPPIIHYVFPRHGLELRCDDDEKISVIFLYFDEYEGFDDVLIEPRFSWSRQQVVEYFGSPSKSGGSSSHPILGDYGAWDRFAMPGYAVRFEYRMDSDSIRKITFMRNDVVP
jgi:hypothetical protein